ncbi:MAG: 2-phosphosulfolactate phosphatase [Cyanobacteria bacterium P01_G01_bin.54]
MYFEQANFDIRCEWGQQGIKHLAATSDVVVIVDVLSFSTCVEIATSRGAIVFPYRWRDHTAKEFAQTIDAELAEKRGTSRYSLSPESLLQIDNGTRLVLPSPNGATLSLATGTTPTLAGCLRNCRAVALAAQQFGQSITIVPAGERWPDGSLRPAFEDLVGAGAIAQALTGQFASHLNGRLSPESQAAVAVYQSVQSNLFDAIQQCSSGRELVEIGFEQDVPLAAQVNVSDCVPKLVNDAYINCNSEH